MHLQIYSRKNKKSHPFRQIEVFFKWIKQNLIVKKLWGHSPNTVKIHLWTAIYTHLIVAYIKHLTKSSLSIYEIMQILRVSAFDKTPISQLLSENVPNQINQNVIDELSLFC
jgi:hypothetical protein